MIARADRSGLGNQLTEIARHIPPRRALIVDVSRMRRGNIDPSLYAHVPDVRIFEGDRVPDDLLAWLYNGMPASFSAECAYNPRWSDIARKAGCRTVIQLNPELAAPEWMTGDVAALPTIWEMARVETARRQIGLSAPVVLPLGVARDRLPPRPHDGTFRTLYHPTAAAMADRQGTQTVLDALSLCRTPFRLLVRSERQGPTRLGRSTIEWLPPCPNYWDAYPDGCDGMVLPRRYGGQSLSINEAASLGWPVVTTDLDPQRQWFPPDALVAPGRPRMVPMKGTGGPFPVYTGDPYALAARLDELADNPDRVLALHEASLRYAESIAWDGPLRQRYEELLGQEAT
jgi:hypothetical protein